MSVERLVDRMKRDILCEKGIEATTLDMHLDDAEALLAIIEEYRGALEQILKHGGDIGQNCTEQNISREAITKADELAGGSDA